MRKIETCIMHNSYSKFIFVFVMFDTMLGRRVLRKALILSFTSKFSSSKANKENGG